MQKKDCRPREGLDRLISSVFPTKSTRTRGSLKTIQRKAAMSLSSCASAVKEKKRKKGQCFHIHQTYYEKIKKGKQKCWSLRRGERLLGGSFSGMSLGEGRKTTRFHELHLTSLWNPYGASCTRTADPSFIGLPSEERDVKDKKKRPVPSLLAP